MGKHLPVLCVNSGVVYPNAVSAAKAYGLSEYVLSKHLAGINKTCGKGLVFIRLSGNESDEDVDRIRKDTLKRVYGIEV